MLSSLDPKWNIFPKWLSFSWNLSRVKGSKGIAPCFLQVNFPGLGHEVESRGCQA